MLATARAQQMLGDLKPASIIRPGAPDPIVWATDEQMQAIEYLKALRSPRAVEPLIPFIGVTFYWKSPDKPNTQRFARKVADKTLLAIDLPAADGILRHVAAGKLDKTTLPAAR